MLEIIATHLSSPDRHGIKPDTVAAALKAGHVPDGTSEPSAALIAHIFTEHSPQQIMTAAHESGASTEAVNQLYLWSLGEGAPRSTAWQHYALEILG